MSISISLNKREDLNTCLQDVNLVLNHHGNLFFMLRHDVDEEV